MSRPRIICHTHTLLNGKIDGIANITSVGMRAQKMYFDLYLGEDPYYKKHRGWLCGAGTSRATLAGLPVPDLPEEFDPVPDGDFIADPDAQTYYFAADGTASVVWDRNEMSFFDVDAHIVALIPASASDAFKAHLRSIGVSYIIAGTERLDMAEAVRKIGDIFDVEELIVGGGGMLNWSMIRDGLCDEVSIVLMPTADGENHTHSLFEANEKYSSPMPYEFALKNVEPLEDGSVWLRYDVKGPVEDD